MVFSRMIIFLKCTHNAHTIIHQTLFYNKFSQVFSSFWHSIPCAIWQGAGDCKSSKLHKPERGPTEMITGKRTHNQRIEQFWRDVYEGVLSFSYNCIWFHGRWAFSALTSKSCLQYWHVLLGVTISPWLFWYYTQIVLDWTSVHPSLRLDNRFHVFDRVNNYFLKQKVFCNCVKTWVIQTRQLILILEIPEYLLPLSDIVFCTTGSSLLSQSKTIFFKSGTCISFACNIICFLKRLRWKRGIDGINVDGLNVVNVLQNNTHHSQEIYVLTKLRNWIAFTDTIARKITLFATGNISKFGFTFHIRTAHGYCMRECYKYPCVWWSIWVGETSYDNYWNYSLSRKFT